MAAHAETAGAHGNGLEGKAGTDQGCRLMRMVAQIMKLPTKAEEAREHTAGQTPSNTGCVKGH